MSDYVPKLLKSSINRIEIKSWGAIIYSNLGKNFNANKIVLEILDLIKLQKTVDGIVEILFQKYDVDRCVLEKDVNNAIKSLWEKGIITWIGLNPYADDQRFTIATHDYSSLIHQSLMKHGYISPVSAFSFKTPSVRFCIINKLYRCYIDTNNSNFVIVLKGHLYLEIIAMCVNTECDFEDLLDFVFYDSGLPLVLKCNCDEDFYNKSFKLCGTLSKETPDDLNIYHYPRNI